MSLIKHIREHAMLGTTGIQGPEGPPGPGLTYPQTAVEIAADITPTSILYPVGNVYRYGAVADGLAETPTDNLLAFQTAHDAISAPDSWKGACIEIPAGDYYLSGTWNISKQCEIKGHGSGTEWQSAATVLHFPQDCNGIRIYSAVTGDGPAGTTSAGNSHLHDFAVHCLDEQATGNGIHATVTIHMNNVRVSGFAGHGCYIAGNVTTGLGSSNLWSATSCDFENNGGDGFHVKGADANAGVALNVNCKGNANWQFYDESLLGNLYVGCHANNNNGVGSIKTVGTANKAVFMRQYVEVAGQYGVEFEGPVEVIGGELLGVPNAPLIQFSGDGSGAAGRSIVSGGAVTGVQMTALGSGYTTCTVTGVGGSGSGAAFTANIVGGKVTSVTVDDGGSGYAGRQDFCAYGASVNALISNQAKIRFRAVETDYGELKIGGDADGNILSASMATASDNINFVRWNATKLSYDTTTNQTGTVTRRITTAQSASETGGRSAAIPTASFMFPQGLWLGSGSTGRHLMYASVMPTSGEYAKGDFVMSTNANVTGASPNKYILIGWKRLVTGTDHVLNTDWAEARCPVEGMTAINAQTGTTYAPVIGDANIEMITLNNASPITVTIPANASVAFPVGTKLNFMQLGAGQVTIAITTDTLNVESSLTLKLKGQYAVATAYKVTSTTWTLFGNLEAA